MARQKLNSFQMYGILSINPRMLAECFSIHIKKLEHLMVFLPLSISICSSIVSFSLQPSPTLTTKTILSVHLRHLIFSNFGSSCTREGLDWISDWMTGKIASLKGLSSIGGCPGKQFSHQPQRYLKEV